MPCDLVASASPAGRIDNSPLADLAGVIVRTFESFSMRGAPTLLLLLSKLDALSRAEATVTLGSHRISFPAFDAYWARYLWAGVPFEPDVAQIFRKLGRGSVLIDCGANIGYWTVRGPDFGFTKVIAVEANANLIPLLRKNFDANEVAGDVLHAAIYSTSGKQLYLDRTAAHAQGALGDKGLPVTSITLAEIAVQYATDQNIVAKLDVEGAELAAIDGAGRLRRITFVYEDFPQQDMFVTRELLSRNFVIFGVAGSGECRSIKTVRDAIGFNTDVAIPGWPSNLVACRPERGEWLADQLGC